LGGDLDVGRLDDTRWTRREQDRTELRRVTIRIGVGIDAGDLRRVLQILREE
jgi:hypothetical protein